MKISQKELKLVLILLSLSILCATYQFVYVRNLNKIDSITDEVKELQSTLSELIKKQDSRDELLESNKNLLNEINQKVSIYGKGFTEEKSIMFIKELENVGSMQVHSISFSSPEFFHNATIEGTTNNTIINEAIGDETTDIETTDAKEQVLVPIDFKTVNGYKSNITINFKVSYAGLKNVIDYINSYPEKRNIKEITLSYDSETGNLNGSMVIQTYHLTNTGIPYTDPVIGGINIGTDNIFGTIDVEPTE